jgi:hypothetical protein
MCTVSYLPLPDKGYLITSNRDEAPHRNAVTLERIRDHGNQVIFPVDPGAGGSWFAVSDTGRTACLLNGAFVPFAPDPKYTQSRGKVLLYAIAQPSLNAIGEGYDLTRTAPFTLVIAESGVLAEHIWDGTELRISNLPAGKPAFWSSVTLYPPDVRSWRMSLFDAWLGAHHEFRQEEIMEFHRYGGARDVWNGFVMNRNERVKTLSITSVHQQGRDFFLRHEDLLTETVMQEEIELRSRDVATR